MEEELIQNMERLRPQEQKEEVHAIYICIHVHEHVHVHVHVGRALCLEYRVSWVRVPPEAIFSLPWVCCVALPCLFV